MVITLCFSVCLPVRLSVCLSVFLSVFGGDCSPGPGYFVDSKITKKGKDGTPSYSMLGRHRDLGKPRLPSTLYYVIHRQCCNSGGEGSGGEGGK